MASILRRSRICSTTLSRVDYEDDEHSNAEDRRVLIGKTAMYGLVAIIYIVRGENTHCVTAR